MLYSSTYRYPKRLDNSLKQHIDELMKVSPGVRRGMVLKIYKAKMYELAGCALKPYELLAHDAPYSFSGPDLSTFDLGTENDPIPLNDAQKRRRKSLIDDLTGAVMLPRDRDNAGYDHPMLMIRFRAGSYWIHEMHMRRYQLLKLINERIGHDFLGEVRFK